MKFPNILMINIICELFKYLIIVQFIHTLKHTQKHTREVSLDTHQVFLDDNIRCIYCYCIITGKVEQSPDNRCARQGSSKLHCGLFNYFFRTQLINWFQEY